MNKKIEVIGVDVGNGYTKTVNVDFVSSVKRWGDVTPALNDKLVEYEGKSYTVGGDRTKTKTDQKKDEICLILALASIAEEIRARKLPHKCRILLSEGLPLERCTEQNKEIDKKYYKSGEIIDFKYEGEPYQIEVVDVLVNPQLVAAIIDMLINQAIPKNCILVDIGSWTCEVLPIENYQIMASKAQSFNTGVIECMLKCNEAIRRRTGKEVPEYLIQQVILGETPDLPDKYVNLCVTELKSYVQTLSDMFEENKYNTEFIPVVFCGGGTAIVKNFGKDIFPLAKYILDDRGEKPNIRINAIGYEKIGKDYLKKMGLDK